MNYSNYINKIGKHLNLINREDLLPSTEHVIYMPTSSQRNIVNSLPAVYVRFKLLRVGLDQIFYENKLEEAYNRV